MVVLRVILTVIAVVLYLVAGVVFAIACRRHEVFVGEHDALSDEFEMDTMGLVLAVLIWPILSAVGLLFGALGALARFVERWGTK